MKLQCNSLCQTLVVIAIFFASIQIVNAQQRQEASPATQRLDSQLANLVADGTVVGAQIAIVRNGEEILAKGYGVIAEDSSHRVDEKTLFLIGSCSKPFASACLLSLIDDPKTQIALDDEIDQWIPAYANATITNGRKSPRAPTVDELLSHRAGIYSQKVGMTKAQAAWIRKFDHTLTDAVDGISKYDLIASPGKRYAYSGAGYCVLGRVAELATGKSFEELLQRHLCRPLGLTRTTFFPAGKFPGEQIAVGRGRDVAPHGLDAKHRLPLIGGSLYSTADEMVRFGRAIADQFNGESNVVHLPIGASISELGKIRSPASGYSIGWRVRQQDGKAVRLSHSGALQSYRALLVVDLEHRCTVAVCWTLSGRKKIEPFAANIDDVINGR